MADKDKFIVGMFLTAVLMVTPGCGSDEGTRHVHMDRNGDGRCDECDASMNATHSSGTGSRYYGLPHYGSIGSGSDGHISTGTAAKAGIGSHAAGGTG
ncbi:MAG: hypothetical protein H6Q65_2920 [Firmicutes bacterium]|nr:hypothetical protein [Bacillota bacterium]